jgi:hypothetical protein
MWRISEIKRIRLRQAQSDKYEGDKNFRSIVTLSLSKRDNLRDADWDQGGVRLRQAQSDKYEGDKNFRSIVTLSLSKRDNLFHVDQLRVENIGVEPMTSSMPWKRSSQLS